MDLVERHTWGIYAMMSLQAAYILHNTASQAARGWQYPTPRKSRAATSPALNTLTTGWAHLES